MSQNYLQILLLKKVKNQTKNKAKRVSKYIISTDSQVGINTVLQGVGEKNSQV